MLESDILLVRVWLFGEFHVERRKDNGAWEAVEKTAWANSYARPLLKRLLCATSRRATRSDLIDDLWSDTPNKGEQYLYTASSKLRQVLHKEIIKPLAAGYELAGPSLLWTDIDECEALMTEAERVGPSSVDVLSLLEKASRHFKRGGMLEGESGQWSLAFRTQQEKAMRYCHIMLAEGYEAQKKLWQAEKQYEWLLEVNPIDEDALCRLLVMLHQHGMIHNLRSSYEQAQKRFEDYGIPLSPTTTKLFEKLMQEPPSLDIYLAPPALKPRPVESEKPQELYMPFALVMPVTYNMSSPSASLPRLEILEMLIISRRQALYNVLNVACASFTLSSSALFPQESREHLERAMTHSSYLDQKALDHLATMTQIYWDLSENAPTEALSGVTGHFTTIVQFLKESRPTPIYERLCALASENALILGTIFNKIREYELAWNYYTFSLKTSQGIQQTDLWASGVGRLALLLIHWAEPQDALPFLGEAQKKGLHNPRLLPWLFAIEAEIHAMKGNTDACLRALEQSKNATLSPSLADDTYVTGFNPSRLAGYEGACFIRLHQPERALPVLKEAFTTHDSTSTHRRSTLLADIGTVHAQLGDMKTAYKLLLQSLDITIQTKSLVVLQRVYKGRTELGAWKDSAEVKELDDRIVEVYKDLARVREQV